MKESLLTFRKAVNESNDLQEKIKGGADIVELGKETGYEFSSEDVTAAYEELQDSEDGLTEFGRFFPWRSYSNSIRHNGQEF